MPACNGARNTGHSTCIAFAPRLLHTVASLFTLLLLLLLSFGTLGLPADRWFSEPRRSGRGTHKLSTEAPQTFESRHRTLLGPGSESRADSMKWASLPLDLRSTGTAVQLSPSLASPKTGKRRKSCGGVQHQQRKKQKERSGRRGRRRKDRGNRKQKRPKKKPREHDCRLRLALVMARELGLGYDSDEVIRFHFCAGDCAAARRTYHKAMESLARPGHAAEIAGLEASRPCCRPTNLTGVSFMDAQHTWRTAERVSASGCHCVI
uniref:glial cell line-derived neurotrophic factor-like n=1 Tax=Myxine glutinosa TaxID=7769 RepID=UPI00358F0434